MLLTTGSKSLLRSCQLWVILFKCCIIPVCCECDNTSQFLSCTWVCYHTAHKFCRIDDIQDNSTLRRGIPVAHSIYGVASTINAANYVMFIALEKVLNLDHPEVWNFANVFCFFTVASNVKFILVLVGNSCVHPAAVRASPWARYGDLLERQFFMPHWRWVSSDDHQKLVSSSNCL